MKDEDDEVNLPLKRYSGNINNGQYSSNEHQRQVVQPHIIQPQILGVAPATIFESNMKEKPAENHHKDSTRKKDADKKKKRSGNKKIERSMRKELEQVSKMIADIDEKIEKQNQSYIE